MENAPGLADVIRFVAAPATARTVALTFDDGPNPPDTVELLDLLAREQVPAVFCLVGVQVAAHPDLVRRIVDDGHVLANHSWRHDDLAQLSPDAVRADLQRTLDAIHAVVPDAPVPFFRAPFGHYGQAIVVAAELGMRTLDWQLAVEDWDPAPPADVLVERLGGIEPGGVVLLHDGGGDRSATVEAVRRVIPRLRADGWTFTVPRLDG
ncbi:polysaccharide deacetylase family protein [Cellulomonas dongxiuzhuiae]|uniref:Polysaccharide deacetylase family protein n=1 Tax=Cellulomonas dongxiuzhuiae TaxID=2819979 RepID=A0ABX8GIV0_9CELL|nr:polysaccharide deacetylase family protein [Cellulomonas dongxiuzhuiae]MBO3089381.1 polysaccharide deacetylase family protein [Cellulomonas dongxiuzhuiae]MBO3094832.1 polysaccharide deacetylase family protein [Cellulomonas dongxiuzhuiae]QWC15865.1 polysaccharide deacetylase family protein [Cellulomonas dongxiuzhuiae]